MDSPLTAWNELTYFKQGATFEERCMDYIAWAKLIGRLAQEYPHLVAVGMDDFMSQLEYFPGDYLAEMESGMRSQSPWLNFVPTVYWHKLFPNDHPDLGLTFDTMLYYFRNEKSGNQCLIGSCGEASVANALGEFSDVDNLIPAGRKLQVGVYFGTHSDEPPPGEGTALYDYNLTRLILNQPSLGGATAYPAQTGKSECTELNSHLINKYCALRKAYGDSP